MKESKIFIINTQEIRRCFKACQDSLDGKNCKCNPPIEELVKPKMINYDYTIQEIEKALEENHIKCDGCGRDGTIQPHTCPYQEEIRNNFDCLCNCCDDCMKECSNDI